MIINTSNGVIKMIAPTLFYQRMLLFAFNNKRCKYNNSFDN